MKNSVRLFLQLLFLQLIPLGCVSVAWAGVPGVAPGGEQCSLSEAGKSMPGYAIAATKRATEHRATMDELHHWLLGEAALDARAKGLTAPLDRHDRYQLGLAPCDDCGPRQPEQRRYQVGIGKPVGLKLRFDQFSEKSLRSGQRLAHGASRATADGGWVWTIKLSSPGASGLRIGLSGLDLPAEAALYVFNERGEAFGPYIGRGAQASGELVTNMLSGDSLYLQLRVTGTPSSMKRLAFSIDEIGHISSKFELARALDASYSQEKLHCTSGISNASCVENAECYGSSDLGSINNVRNAIGAMLFRSGGGYYICSGGLIANSAGDPLFLTANHCISKGREASSLEVYWNHTTPCGTRSCSNAWTVQGRASEVGASILAKGGSGDYSLLQLASTLPSGAYALGWNSTPVANSNNTLLHRISHPQGAPQAYSEQHVDTGAGTCGTLPRGTYIYSTDAVGATEGGSSGSPVLNSDGEIVGQLYGACGTNLNDVCDSGSNATVDGAFAGYFADVEAFLTSGGGDPGGGYSLDVSGRKVKGKWVSELSWSGTSAGNVDIYRDQSKIATVANTGSYTDETGLRGGGSLSYQVCDAGTSTCSNTATVSF